MKSIASAVLLFATATTVQAHVADMPTIVHITEHGWLSLAVLCILILLLPSVRRPR